MLKAFSHNTLSHYTVDFKCPDHKRTFEKRRINTEKKKDRDSIAPSLFVQFKNNDDSRNGKNLKKKPGQQPGFFFS